MSSEWQINKERERIANLDRVLEDPRDWYVMLAENIEETRKYNLDPQRPINKKIAEEEHLEEQKRYAEELIARNKQRRKIKREEQEMKKEKRKEIIKKIPNMTAMFVLALLTFIPFISSSDMKVVSFDEPIPYNSNVAYANDSNAEIDEEIDEENVIEVPVLPARFNDRMQFKRVISYIRNNKPINPNMQL